MIGAAADQIRAYPLHAARLSAGGQGCKISGEPPFPVQALAMGEGMFKTVLWATDGSVAAERALPVAKSIAQTYNAKLVVTHVSMPFAVLVGPRHPVTPHTAGIAQESADAIRANLERKVEDLKRDGISVEFALFETHSAAQTIAAFAREVGADLIVAGTSGSSRLVRVLVGSVTRRLLELAPCPVLAVPPEDEDVTS
jgi:nucleotide-binding universal stress UspA family protein